MLLLSVWVWVEISQGYLLGIRHSLLIITEQIGVAAALKTASVQILGSNLLRDTSYPD
jgi:hypothetical protein